MAAVVVVEVVDVCALARATRTASRGCECTPLARAWHPWHERGRYDWHDVSALVCFWRGGMLSIECHSFRFEREADSTAAMSLVVFIVVEQD